MYSMRQSLFGRRPAWVPALAALLVLAVLQVPAAAETGCSPAGFPRTVVDGLGNEIFLERPPQRIFSAVFATDAMVLALVDPQRVVGVTRFAADPSISAVADKVAPHMVVIDQLNPETVLAAQPDIVLVAFYSNPDAVRQIRDLGLKVFTFTAFDTLLDAVANFELTAEITGCEGAASDILQGVFASYGRLAAKLASVERPTVLSWGPWGNTSGSGTTLHDIIQMAGGVNVAAQHGISGWKDIDLEAIAAMNPDVIITYAGEEFVRTILEDPALQAVTAVKTRRVYHVDHTDAPDLHIFLAVEELAKMLHPEVFE